jgi:hypothetical protein
MEFLMPHITRAPGQVVICCRVPDHASEADASRWRAEASSRGIEVTWCVAPTGMRSWLSGADSGRELAVRIGDADREGSLSRGEIQAAVRLKGVSAAVVDGDRPLDHRRLLVENGIEIVVTQRLHPVNRQTRRPAPLGWDCRCVLWGLWEAGYTAPRRRLLGLLEDSRPRAGGLTVISTGCRPGERAEAGIARLRQTLGHLQASLRSHRIEPRLLADLPTVLPRGHSNGDRGSILAAA